MTKWKKGAKKKEEGLSRKGEQKYRQGKLIRRFACRKKRAQETGSGSM